MTKQVIKNRSSYTEMARVAIWNATAGKSMGDGIRNPDMLVNQLGYLHEEAKELHGAYIRQRHHDLLDAVGDLLVVAAGVLHLNAVDEFPRLPATGEVDESLQEMIDNIFFLTQAVKEDPFKLEPNNVANVVISNCCSIAHYFGYDPEEILRIVNESNFSKFCKTIDEARASVAAYKAKKRYTHVKYKLIGDLRVVYGNDTLEGTTDKILKSVHFREPCFIELIKKVNPEFLDKVGGVK